MNIFARIAPPVVLLVLAPLVAEYLLGDLNIRQLVALVALAPLYGGGAVLIREAVRRTGRSWPSFVLLALAYAIVEEGMLTQSLFNRDYLHLRLLDYGFVPALGTSPPWAIYVIGIHVMWSLAVPIGLAESLFAERRTQPWLGPVGLGIFAILFGLGAFAVSRFSLALTPFRASPGELIACAILVAALVTAAFVAPRAGPARTDASGTAVRPLPISIFCFAAGSAFLSVYALCRSHWPWPLTAAAGAALGLILCAFFAWANRGRPWGAIQTFAAAAGGLLCYAWFGYRIDRAMHGGGDFAAHSIFVLGLLAVAGWAGIRAVRLKQN
jgi:hypothetical protein